jgi:hypothetical protein
MSFVQRGYRADGCIVEKHAELLTRLRRRTAFE